MQYFHTLFASASGIVDLLDYGKLIFDLASKRKYAILTAFVIAAILTPPDVISQILLALPIIALYEISIIFSRFLSKE